MAWAVLIVSGLLETVRAIALDRSAGLSRPLAGFSRPLPSVTFLVSLALSMAGLAYALRTVPVGTGYVVWVGIGAVGTAVTGMVALGEPATLPRLICLLLVVAGVVGLKVFH